MGNLPNDYKLNLLVLQATPFCNINCSYCYLPDRSVKDFISMDVIRKTFEELFDSSLISNQISVVWHAGEPLVAPISLYQEAINLINSMNDKKVLISHSMQTNAMLINQKWCNFIKEYDIKIGVSIDGPEFLHDAYRKTRSGKGTIKKVLSGIGLLQKNEIDFHVITVLTDKALDYPDEICNFYLENNISRVGFNVEELEGINQSSSLNTKNSKERYKMFMTRFLELSRRHKLRIREFSHMASIIEEKINPLKGQQSNPFSIVSIDCKGNISTFSPELIGMKNEEFGNFIFGNVLETSIESIIQFDHFKRLNNSIQEGVSLCRESCDYYQVCGGGAPANKLYENNSFATTETMYCRLNKQVIAELIISDYENKYKN